MEPNCNTNVNHNTFFQVRGLASGNLKIMVAAA
jgi:hypothetical protein